MKKKKHSLVRLFSCAALAVAMMFSMAAPVIADPGANSSYSEGTDAAHPARAAITKRLKMPVNTAVPDDAQFTFTFTATGKDGGAVPDGMPEISPVVADLTTSGTDTYTDGGTIYVVKETSNFIAGITGTFPGPGIYTYQVRETASNIDITDGTNEGTTNSSAVYDLELWVDEDSEGNLFVKYVSAKTVTGSVDEYYPGDEGGNKVDPTPGGTNEVNGTTIEDDYSQVIFTNSYWTSDGGGTENPDQTALEIVKKITGNGADLTDRFPFDVTVQQPAAVSPDDPAQTYQVCVLNANGDVITTSANYAGTIEDGFFTVTSGEPFTVNLTNNERLAFVDLHIGSDVEVEEKANEDYKAKYVRTFAGNTEYTAADKDMAWGFPVNSSDAGPHYISAGAGENTVTFTNMRAGATPTGISVDNLPFIALIGVAIAGLVGFVITKSRKRGQADA